MDFIEEAKLYLKAGDGGDGCEVFVEKNSSNLAV